MENNKYASLLQEKRIEITDTGRASAANGIGDAQLEAILNGMCRPQDIVGVSSKDFYEVLDLYCKENGFPLISKKTFGSFLRRRYGIEAKVVNVAGKAENVYTKSFDTKEEKLDYAKGKIKELNVTEDTVKGAGQQDIQDFFDKVCNENDWKKIEPDILKEAIIGELGVKQGISFERTENGMVQTPCYL